MSVIPGAAKDLRFAVAVALLAACSGDRAPAHAPYRDPTLPADTRVRDLLARMSPEEKFWQLYMAPGDPADSRDLLSHGAYGLQLLPRPADSTADAADTPERAARRMAARAIRVQRFFTDSTRLGIPAILFEEGVHGLAQRGATVYPAAIALAATWDTALVARVAAAIAREASARGVRQLLSPVLNLGRDPRWGRTEETWGEDVLLASNMALSFVIPLERGGIATTPKHFVANYGDGGRDSHPIEVSERQLEEVFFPPFRAAIGPGRARSVMAAYNSVDGTPATQSHALLTATLRDAWGFRGVTISDQAGVGGANVLHFTSPDNATSVRLALDAGLDVIFQSSVEQSKLFRKPFDDRTIPQRTIDSAVARVLRLKVGLGIFEHPLAHADSAALLARDPALRALAREAALEAAVLLRNERNTLPLAPTVTRVAVIGADASEARLGGYTAPGARGSSILEAVRARLGARGTARYAPGPGRLARTSLAVPPEFLSHDSAGASVAGLHGEYFDNIALAGTPAITRSDATLDFAWTLGGPSRAVPKDWYSARWTGILRVPESGSVRLGIEGNDGYRLWLDGRLVIDNWRKRSNGAAMVPVRLERGRAHAIRVEYFETTGNGHVRLSWNRGVADDARARIADAVAAARASQAAIVVAGIEEGEFRDRSSLKLPGRQEELIAAVAATGTPTVVVLIGGGAITMTPWLERVGAVLDAWYPGAEGGPAIAAILWGDANPSGRLPVTFPISEGQLPLTYDHKPTGRGDDYLDLTGQPLFPFGHGLSYTTFEYSALSIAPQPLARGARATVTCRVKNTGARAGSEVVQLYIRRSVSSVAQPLYKLAGFRRVALAPGEEREVAFTLGDAELAILDTDRRRVVEPGEVRVLVGASSRDLRLRGTLVVK